MQLKANSVEEYLEAVPEERREAFKKLRQTIVDHIPDGFEECINYGMIGYVVPLSTYPAGYHVTPDAPLPFCNIGLQKNFIGFYHSGIYASTEMTDWFVSEYKKAAKYKLDMGKSCVRLKRVDDIPYELIGELMEKITVDDWIRIYEANLKK